MHATIVRRDGDGKVIAGDTDLQELVQSKEICLVNLADAGRVVQPAVWHVSFAGRHTAMQGDKWVDSCPPDYLGTDLQAKIEVPHAQCLLQLCD